MRASIATPDTSRVVIAANIQKNSRMCYAQMSSDASRWPMRGGIDTPSQEVVTPFALGTMTPTGGRDARDVLRRSITETRTSVLRARLHAARTVAHAGDDGRDSRRSPIETSFGHAFGLELDHELVLLHLQPSTEVLVAYADRIEAALLAQGWQPVEAPPLTTKERS